MEDQFERDRQERRGRFRERFWENNPYALSLLKGHLLVEEVLEEIIVSGCNDPSAVYEARLNFYSKTKIAQAIAGISSPAWHCSEKLNSARNELAHGRDAKVLEEKIDALIRACRQAFPDVTWQGDRLPDLDLVIVAVHASLSRIAADRLRA